MSKNKYIYPTIITLMIIFSCIMAYIQAVRIITLVDYTYLIESAFRIYKGQIPYRDFLLMYPAGTFYIITFFWNIFGCNEHSILIMQVVCQLFYCLLTYNIIRQICSKREMHIALLSIILLSGHVISSNPNYDILENIAVLIIINLWIYAHKHNSYISYFLTGLSLGLALLFKQNVAIIFVLLFFALMVIDYYYNKSLKKHILIECLGAFLSTSFLVILCYTSGFGNDVVTQLFIYPSTSRSPFPIIQKAILGFFKKINIISIPMAFLVYWIIKKIKNHSLALSISLLFILIIWPSISAILKHIKGNDNTLYFFTTCWYYIIIIGLIAIVVDIYYHNLRKEDFYLLLIMMYIGANITSQGFTGSTYALYPALSILLAIIFEKYNIIAPISSQICITTCILVSTCALFITNVRMNYVVIDGPKFPSSHPKLTNVTAYGSYLPELDELAYWIEANVTQDESFIILPGEDPVYYMTDHEQPLKYFQLNTTVFPYTIEAYANDCINNNITYIVIKTNPQCTHFIEYLHMADCISNNYNLYQSLTGYDIYKIANMY